MAPHDIYMLNLYDIFLDVIHNTFFIGITVISIFFLTLLVVFGHVNLVFCIKFSLFISVRIFDSCLIAALNKFVIFFSTILLTVRHEPFE